MTHREQTLCIFAVILNRALLVDCNFVGLVAQGMHLCDTVDSRFRGGTWGRGRCFDLHRRRDDVGFGRSMIRGSEIVESEEGCEDGDLQALAVGDVKAIEC